MIITRVSLLVKSKVKYWVNFRKKEFTSGDDRVTKETFNSILHTQIKRSIIPRSFMSLSLIDFYKRFKLTIGHIFWPEVIFQKERKSYCSLHTSKSSLKFSWKSIKSSLRNYLEKKKGKRKILIRGRTNEG
jgi:hypothetical protein